MRAQLKLLTALFIYVWRTQYRKYPFVCRQRNGSSYDCTGTADSFNDLLGGFIHQVVIV